MKNEKAMMKRMAAEYRNREDYSRLLEKYFRLQRENEALKARFDKVNELHLAESETCCKLVVTVIVLGNLLLFSLIGCVYLWGRGV